MVELPLLLKVLIMEITDQSGDGVGVRAPILLSDVEAAKLFGVSRRKFQELRQQPWMPKPRVLGARLLRWVRSELESAVLSIPQQDHSCEPERLRRARIERMKAGTPPNADACQIVADRASPSTRRPQAYRGR